MSIILKRLYVTGAVALSGFIGCGLLSTDATSLALGIVGMGLVVVAMLTYYVVRPLDHSPCEHQIARVLNGPVDMAHNVLPACELRDSSYDYDVAGDPQRTTDIIALDDHRPDR